MKFRYLLAALLAMALLAASCGSDDATSTEDAASDAAAAADTSSSDADDGDAAMEDDAMEDGGDADMEDDAMEDGDDAAMEEDAMEDGAMAEEMADAGTFVYAMPFPIFDLDPSSSFSSENIVLQNVYETLTRYNPPGSADLLSPGLAESWEASDDSLTWTFTLREGVTFHDGTPMTAQSVVDSLGRTLELDLGAAFILYSVDTMTAIDDLTVEFTLLWPTPFDLVMSSNYGVYIVSANALGQDGDWFNAGNEGGTGPYMIDSYSPNESIVLTAYEDYWGGWEAGQFMEADFQLIEDPVLAEQMVRNGDAHFTYNLPFDSYTALDGVDGLDVVRGESMTNLFGLLNHERLSPELREAMVLSFPYDDIVAALYGGEATRAQGIVPQAVWGSATLDLPDTDLERAAELVAAAGAEGTSVSYSYDAGTVEQQQIGEVWKANLATIGIDLQLDPLTFDARWELAQADPANAQDIFTMFWFPTFVTPYDFLFSLFHSEDDPFFNLGYYSNEDFDFLIDDADALTGTDLDAAIELFQEAQQLLIDDNAAVFMVDVPDVSVIADSIDGHVPNPGYANVVRLHELTQG